MKKDTLKQRGRALEDTFFARQSEELRLQLKEKMELADKREALAAASGIQSEAVLNNLLEAGVEAQTMAALSLIPLIAVAWADGTMDGEERTAILKASSEHGIGEGHIAYSLLLGWLEHKPDAGLFDTWLQYVQTLAGDWEDGTRAEFKAEIMDRARRVAQSAGGFLGIGSISGSETEVLDAIEAAVSTPGE